ncbi:MAG: hypothetical protein ACYC3X_29275 [Pirellulaceae bacterium]
MTIHCSVRIAAVGLLVLCASQASAQAPDAARVTEIAGWMEKGTYNPTPTIEDRDFWARVGKSQSYRAVVADAEKQLRETFQPLPDDLYLEYFKQRVELVWTSGASSGRSAAEDGAGCGSSCVAAGQDR